MTNFPKEPIPESTDNPSGADDTPRFGRLLVVLIVAVLLIVAITFGSETYFSP